MQHIRNLLEQMETLRAQIDSFMVRERMPYGFVSRTAALIVLNGLDSMIEDLMDVIEVAQAEEDHAHRRNDVEGK